MASLSEAIFFSIASFCSAVKPRSISGVIWPPDCTALSKAAFSASLATLDFANSNLRVGGSESEALVLWESIALPSISTVTVKTAWFCTMATKWPVLSVLV